MIFTIPWEDSFSLVSIGSLTRLIGLVAAGFWLLKVLWEGRFRKPHIFHVLVLLFFLWSGLTYLWTIDSTGTMDRINTYAQVFILLYILWDLYQEPADLNAGLQAYILGAYVSIVGTLINYIQGTNAVVYEGRYSATGINAVDLALILLLGLPVAWYLLVRVDQNKNSIFKIINFAYIPLSIFATFLTGSRTSLFAIIPAAIYILWPKRAGIGRLIASICALVLAFFFFRAILPASVIERLSTVISSVQAADLSGRVTLWRETLSVFTVHPIFGSGSGTLFTATGIGSDSHNTFLSVLAETGAIGFLLFMSIVGLVVYQAIKLAKGYTGLCLATVSVWAIGVLSLSWEFRKPTWIFLNFVIIEGCMIHKQIQAQKVKPLVSGTGKPSTLPKVAESQV